MKAPKTTSLSDRYLAAQVRAHEVLGETRRGATFAELFTLRLLCRAVLANPAPAVLEELHGEIRKLVTDPEGATPIPKVEP